MKKDILIFEKNGGFLDLWVQDDNSGFSAMPGWVRLIHPGGSTSGLRIVSSTEDAGLRKIRVQPLAPFLMKNIRWDAGSVERIGSTQPPPSDTVDDAITNYNNAGSTSSFEWKYEYLVVVVILLAIGYAYYKYR